VEKMELKQRNTKTRVMNENGFSIIELMVSMIVFLIFMGAIFGVLRIGTIQKTSASASSDVVKNARLSLNTIGRDAVNAGFGYSRIGGYAPDNILNARLGLPSDAGTAHDLVTAVIAGNDVNPNTLLPSGNTDVVSFIFRDTSFNNGQVVKMIAAADYGGNGVQITTAAGQATLVRPYDLFLITDCCRTALAMVTSTPGGDILRFQDGAADPLGINQKFTGTADTTSKLAGMDYSTTSSGTSARKVIWVKYHVASDGTLIRTTFGNNTGNPVTNQIQTQPIAFNVQNFQVKYLLRDGTVSDDPSAGGTTQENFNNVVQLDITITALVKTVENGVTLNNKTVIKSTFSTKNLSYDNG
jgi:prepilin-type N-terminal cleavage/methylation domain-containing protein